MHLDVPASPTESKRLLFVTPTADDDSQWLLDVRARLISGVSLCEQVPPNWNGDMEVTRCSSWNPFFIFLLQQQNGDVLVPGSVQQPHALAVEAYPCLRCVLCRLGME